MIELKQVILVFGILKSGSTACYDPAGKSQKFRDPLSSKQESKHMLWSRLALSGEQRLLLFLGEYYILRGMLGFSRSHWNL